MAEKEVNISFETLYELQRRERDRADLQELPKTFFQDVVNYLKDKKAMLEKQSHQTELFSENESTDLKKQLENITRILKDLYERREKKIMDMAINKSRTRSNLVNTSSMLKEEQLLFDEFVCVMSSFRAGILDKMLKCESPLIEENGKNLSNESNLGAAEKKEAAEAAAAKDSKLVRFLSAVPTFVGRELETYGPFEEDDVANLPKDIAEILVGKGRAEEIVEE